MTKTIFLIILAVILNSCMMINSSMHFPAMAYTPEGCVIDESLLVVPPLEKIPDNMKNDQDFVEKKLIAMVAVHRSQLKLLIEEIKSCK